MIFGGHFDEFIKQISIVESCGLRRIGSLPMEFYQGACNTFQTSGGTDETLLCFDKYAPKDCHR